jgi:hypothetical protein
MRGATSRASTFVFVGIPILYYSAAKFFPKNGVGHMAAKPHDRKRGRFQLNSMLWRPYSDIQQSAQQYRTTGLLKSDRAYLVYFFIVTSVISLTFAIFSDVGPLGGECLIWEECFLNRGCTVGDCNFWVPLHIYSYGPSLGNGAGDHLVHCGQNTSDATTNICEARGSDSFCPTLLADWINFHKSRDRPQARGEKSDAGQSPRSTYDK